MSRPAAGKVTGQRFQRTFITLASLDLSTVYVRDTLIVDDTGAQATATVQLAKIGTAYAPVGKRLTIRKASNVAHIVALNPAQIPVKDGISTSAPAIFPGLSTNPNTAALPVSVPNSVTIEATDMDLSGSTQPNPLGGTPTSAGAWMIVASSVAGI